LRLGARGRLHEGRPDDDRRLLQHRWSCRLLLLLVVVVVVMGADTTSWSTIGKCGGGDGSGGVCGGGSLLLGRGLPLGSACLTGLQRDLVEWGVQSLRSNLCRGWGFQTTYNPIL